LVHSSWGVMLYQIRLYNPFYLFISSCSLLERTLCLEWFVSLKGVVNPDLVLPEKF